MKLAKRSRPRPRFWALSVVSASLVLACLTVTGTALGAGRNSGNAKLCQKGGWQELQSNTGDTFASQDECVSYGAEGGSLFHPSVTANPTHVPEGVDSFVTVAGFHPSSSGDLTIHALPAGGTVTVLGVPTNASGGLPVFSTGFTAGACANGVTGAELTFEDVFGVHASTIVTLDCP